MNKEKLQVKIDHITEAFLANMGMLHQLHKFYEELYEFMAEAIKTYNDKERTSSDLKEELADLIICSNYFMKYFGIKPNKQTEFYKPVCNDIYASIRLLSNYACIDTKIQLDLVDCHDFQRLNCLLSGFCYEYFENEEEFLFYLEKKIDKASKYIS